MGGKNKGKPKKKKAKRRKAEVQSPQTARKKNVTRAGGGGLDRWEQKGKGERGWWGKKKETVGQALEKKVIPAPEKLLGPKRGGCIKKGGGKKETNAVGLPKRKKGGRFLGKKLEQKKKRGG